MSRAAGSPWRPSCSPCWRSCSAIRRRAWWRLLKRWNCRSCRSENALETGLLSPVDCFADGFRRTPTREFARLDRRGEVYLDYGGSALYGSSQLAAHQRLLADGLFGNPHSESDPSRASTAVVEAARRRVLRHFDTTEREYAVCFCANASAAIKLVAESYAFSAAPSLRAHRRQPQLDATASASSRAAPAHPCATCRWIATCARARARGPRRDLAGRRGRGSVRLPRAVQLHRPAPPARAGGGGPRARLRRASRRRGVRAHQPA